MVKTPEQQLWALDVKEKIEKLFDGKHLSWIYKNLVHNYSIVSHSRHPHDLILINTITQFAIPTRASTRTQKKKTLDTRNFYRSSASPPSSSFLLIERSFRADAGENK